MLIDPAVCVLLQELRGGSRRDRRSSRRGRGSGSFLLGELRCYVDQRIYRRL